MLAARKRLITSETSIVALEREWAKYKYLILAKNPNGYKQLRALLKDKSEYPVKEFFAIVDESLAVPENRGYEINAAQHVAGYFKNKATAEEKDNIALLINNYSNNKVKREDIKQALYVLAKKYNETYLLQSYYFSDCK